MADIRKLWWRAGDLAAIEMELSNDGWVRAVRHSATVVEPVWEMYRDEPNGGPAALVTTALALYAAGAEREKMPIGDVLNLVRPHAWAHMWPDHAPTEGSAPQDVVREALAARGHTYDFDRHTLFSKLVSRYTHFEPALSQVAASSLITSMDDTRAGTLLGFGARWLVNGVTGDPMNRLTAPLKPVPDAQEMRLRRDRGQVSGLGRAGGRDRG